MLSSSGWMPGVVESPGVVDPTPGAFAFPPPDWPVCPVGGAPDESGVVCLFTLLDWPVELLLVSEPYGSLLTLAPDWLAGGAPSSRWLVTPC